MAKEGGEKEVAGRAYFTQRKWWGLLELSSVAEMGLLPQDSLGRRHSEKGQVVGPWTPLSGDRLCPS